MQERRLSLETARLAKQAGFFNVDSSCFCFESTPIKRSGTSDKYDMFYPELGLTVPDEEHDIKLCFPTLGLLHLWLINKQNLYCSCYPIKDKWECDVRNCDMSLTVHESEDLPLKNMKFDSYEDALETAEQYALKKLIG